MHVHSHMPMLQPEIASRPLKREPSSEEATEIRRIFEQSADQRQKNPRHPSQSDTSSEDTHQPFESAPADDKPAVQAGDTLWRLLGSVTSGPLPDDAAATAATPSELSLDDLLARIVKPA